MHYKKYNDEYVHLSFFMCVFCIHQIYNYHHKVSILSFISKWSLNTKMVCKRGRGGQLLKYNLMGLIDWSVFYFEFHYDDDDEDRAAPNHYILIFLHSSSYASIFSLFFAKLLNNDHWLGHQLTMAFSEFIESCDPKLTR